MNLRGRARLLAAMAITAIASMNVAALAQEPVHSATVVMTIANNRVFVPMRVTGPNGKSRIVQFWVDSGGDTLALSGRLAAELGLKPVGGSFIGMGEQRSLWVTPPRLAIQGMQIDLEHVGVSASSSRSASRVFSRDGSGRISPSHGAQEI